MNIELVQQIVDYIKKLAEPLATAGYELVLKQVRYELIVNIIWSIVGLGLIIGSIFFWKKVKHFDWIGAEYVLGILMTGLGIGLFFGFLFPAINTIVNPDWMAIQMIMNLVSGN